MKNFRSIALLLLFSIITTHALYDPTPDVEIAEASISINALALNKIISFLGDLIDNLIGVDPINMGNSNYQQYCAQVGLILQSCTFNSTNTKLATHLIDWKNSAVQVVADVQNQFQFSINKVALTLVGDGIFTNLANKNTYSGNYTLIIPSITLNFTVSLTTTSIYAPSIGFLPQVTQLVGVVGQNTFHMQNQTKNDAAMQSYIQYMLNSQFGAVQLGIIKTGLNTALSLFSKGPLSPEYKIGDYKYKFNYNFPAGVYQVDTDIRVPLNIESITNEDTQDVCPSKQIVPLPAFYYANHTDHYDFQIMVGTGLLNQLVWTFANAHSINFTLNSTSTTMANFPTSLNLVGLRSILPDLYAVYIAKGLSPDNGVYVSVLVTPQIPNFRLVSGRLVGTLNAQLEIRVDMDGDEYPVADINDCNCSLALVLDVVEYFAIDIYSPGGFTIGMNLSNLEIVSAVKKSGIINFDSALFTTGMTYLMSSIVSNINSQFAKGVEIPLVSSAPFLKGITVVFEQGFILVNIGISPSN